MVLLIFSCMMQTPQDKKMTMLNVDRHVSLSSRSTLAVLTILELCILRFLPESDQFLAPRVCKGLRALIYKSISETKVKVRCNGEGKFWKYLTKNPMLYSFITCSQTRGATKYIHHISAHNVIDYIYNSHFIS